MVPAADGQQPTIVIQPRESLFGRFGKLLLIALGLCVLMLVGMASSYQQYFGDGLGPTERYHSLSRDASSKVAIVTVNGTIMEGDDFVEKQLKRVEEDDSVVAMVLRIDSPGGTVTYSNRLYHKLNRLTEKRGIPTVVSMGSLCASGGYYLAMAVGDQEGAIFAEPTTWTGSIGVVIPNYNFSRMMGVVGVQDLSFASGDLKLMGSPTRSMTDEQSAVLQRLVDESYADFRDIVKAGRPAFRDDEAALDTVATGQIFTAKQALELGLVDKLGYLEEAVERAAELAGVSTGGLRCVDYQRQVTPIESLLGASAPERPAEASIDVRALVELSTPRAYYLCTLLPALLESR